MSQTIITLAFEQYKAQQEAIAAPVELDEFVLANVPNQDASLPIDRNEGLPPQAQIVLVADVSQAGYVNPNAVVYSLLMDTRIGDFDFNWIGLRNKVSGVIAAISHIPTVHKLKTVLGVQNGNSVTRSIMMSYSDAKGLTNIDVDASTWQIDFTARLFGMDEAERLANIDLYGHAAFLANGYQVIKSGSSYKTKQGTGYVGGLRCHTSAEIIISGVANSMGIYLDASWQGGLTSQWQTVVSIKASTQALIDYVDSTGLQHYVTKLADINSAGDVFDCRFIGGTPALERKDNAATNSDIDNNSSADKHVNLPQFWRGIKAFFSNKYDGDSDTLVVTEKALSTGLATKLNKSDASADTKLFDAKSATWWKRGILPCAKSFMVHGDADKYYPVLIVAGSNYQWADFHISRLYSAQAPNTWYNSTHKGGLTFNWQATGDTGWGGNDKQFRVIEFSETYSEMVGGMELSASGMVVWLRGGTAEYYFTSSYGTSSSLIVNLTDYKSIDNKIYPVLTYADAIVKCNQTIYPRFTNRDSGHLYDNGQRVYSPENKPGKEDVDLDQVNNFPATSDVNNTSPEYYATAAMANAAFKKAQEAMNEKQVLFFDSSIQGSTGYYSQTLEVTLPANFTGLVRVYGTSAGYVEIYLENKDYSTNHFAYDNNNDFDNLAYFNRIGTKLTLLITASAGTFSQSLRIYRVAI
ncbi:phage tail protein [Moritella sp. 5]|uniref:phage tail-collar fiber domain-containing protein n=1 Tax=Moritella sp. 5 TaxID=2746231 RepID=UPI001BA492CD|nr:phage tail protein [Moritella sp. 5]QUM81661.1 phage tail protein [Moritella sp. 5]